MSIDRKDRGEVDSERKQFPAKVTGQAASNESPWRKDPTPIVAPKPGSTKPPLRSSMGNPFTRNNIKDNLRGVPSRQNPCARSVVDPHNPEPIKRSSKRQKLTNGSNGSILPSGTAPRSPSTSGSRLSDYTTTDINDRSKGGFMGNTPDDVSSSTRNATHQYLEINNVPSDENGEEQVSSPSAGSSRVARVLRGEESPRLKPNGKPYSLPPAPNTEKVRNKLGISAGGFLSSDPIEDPSSFDNSTQYRSSLEKYTGVKGKIALFDGKDKGTEFSTQNHPSRVAGMKRKDGKRILSFPGGEKGNHAYDLGKPPNSATQRLPSTCFKTESRICITLEAVMANQRMVSGSESIRLTLLFYDNKLEILSKQRFNTNATKIVEFSGFRNIRQFPSSMSSPNDFICLELQHDSDADVTYSISGEVKLPEVPKGMILLKLAKHDEETWNSTKYLERLLNNDRVIALRTSQDGKSNWERLLRGYPENDTLSVEKSSGDSSKSKPKPRQTFSVKTGQHNIESTYFERRITRSAQLPERRRKGTLSPPPDELILVYPPSGTGALNLTYADIKRLDPGEFLNDVLIEFGLKLWLNELRSSNLELAQQIHVFSSFFFTQLNQKNFDEGYSSVRKWTSKINLFDKKFIIVPINEHLHWYLAIICYPGRTLQCSPETEGLGFRVNTRAHARTNVQIATSTVSRFLNRSPNSFGSTVASDLDELEVEREIEYGPQRPSLSPLADDDKSVRVKAASSASVDKPIRIPTYPRDEKIVPIETASGTECEMDTSLDRTADVQVYGNPGLSNKSDVSEDPIALHSDDEEIDELENDDKMEVDTPPLTNDLDVVVPPKLEHPHIFTFDSLGSRHPHAIKVLTRYLELEAKDKRSWENPVGAQGKAASVPVQPNYCDCGIYLLHFVEQFMSKPEAFIQHILDPKGKKVLDTTRVSREELWQHSKVGQRRNELRQRILSMSKEWKGKHQETKGKSKIASEPPEETVQDSESEVEVLEITQPPSKQPKRQKALRIR